MPENLQYVLFRSGPQSSSSMGHLRKVLADLRLFCGRTGLHGYSYAAHGRNRLEVAFWALCCVGALAWTGQICWDGFMYWRTNPVEIKYLQKCKQAHTVCYCRCVQREDLPVLSGPGALPGDIHLSQGAL